MEELSSTMEDITRVNGKTTIDQARENMFTQMEKLRKDNGKRASFKVNEE